jgi:glycerate 2-kinase
MRPDSSLLLLAAGTDGSDGGINQIEADAGAIVDSGTLQRGELEGFDVIEALTQANAGAFLAASGDLISTGPTGANVMDLVIASVCHNEDECGRIL